MIEAPRLRPGKKGEGDNAHCFLRVIATVRMRHPGRAKDLQLAENRMDCRRRKTMEDKKKREHHQSAEEKTSQRRCNHRNNYLWPESAVPFQDGPVSARGRERGSAQAANQRMTGTRRETDPPGRNVPGEGSNERAQHRRHGHDTGVHQPFPTVEATAPPSKAPVKLKIAAIAMACRGVSTLVETTVAMALAAS